LKLLIQSSCNVMIDWSGVELILVWVSLASDIDPRKGRDGQIFSDALQNFSCCRSPVNTVSDITGYESESGVMLSVAFGFTVVVRIRKSTLTWKVE